MSEHDHNAAVERDAERILALLRSRQPDHMEQAMDAVRTLGPRTAHVMARVVARSRHEHRLGVAARRARDTVALAGATAAFVLVGFGHPAPAIAAAALAIGLALLGLCWEASMMGRAGYLLSAAEGPAGIALAVEFTAADDRLLRKEAEQRARRLLASARPGVLADLPPRTREGVLALLTTRGTRAPSADDVRLLLRLLRETPLAGAAPYLRQLDAARLRSDLAREVALVAALIQERTEREAADRRLLRPAQAPPETTLLRPASSAPDAPPEQLLRPADKEGGQSGPRT